MTDTMESFRNPFSPGAGSRPPELAGRDNILEDARTALRRVMAGRSAQSQILLGLRGTGKTVLLNEIESFAETERHLTSFIEAAEGKSLAEMLYPQMRQTLRRLSTVEKARLYVHKGLAGLRGFASIFKIKVGDVELGVEPEPGLADSGDLELDVTDLFLAIGNAAKAAGRGWSLFIDEIQYLETSELAALIVAIHRVNQKNLPVILFGAGLPQIARLSGDAKSYAERLFTFPSIGALDKSAAIEAIRNPLEKEGISIDDDALDEILAKTSGYPFFLQEWGHQAWNIVERNPIKVGDIENASKRAFRRLDDGFFKVRLDRLTPTETAYVNAMALIGPGPYKSKDVAKALGKKPSKLGPRRASIIKKGMIYSPSYGDVDFTVPLFDEFLRRRASDPTIMFDASNRKN